MSSLRRADIVSRGDNYLGPGCVGVTGLLKLMRFLKGVNDGSVTFIIGRLSQYSS